MYMQKENLIIYFKTLTAGPTVVSDLQPTIQQPETNPTGTTRLLQLLGYNTSLLQDFDV